MTGFDELPLASEFTRFWECHESHNRYLWSTRVAAQFAWAYAHSNGVDPSTPLRTFLRDHLKKRWRRPINLSHYKGPYIDSVQARPDLTVEHFLADLKDIALEHTYESIVTNEIHALELLFDNVFEIVAKSVVNSASIDATARANLRDTLARVTTDERYSITVKQLSDLLPTVGALLRSSTYKREVNPFLSTTINGVSCMDAVGMWKEVRNLLVHHDGRATKGFSSRWSGIYLSVLTDKMRRQRRIPPGSRLSVSLRQAVFCMTTCHQSASVLYVAIGRPAV